MTKVLISLDDALLRRIDRIAKSRGLSRSAYLAELAERDASGTRAPEQRRLHGAPSNASTGCLLTPLRAT